MLAGDDADTNADDFQEPTFSVSLTQTRIHAPFLANPFSRKRMKLPSSFVKGNQVIGQDSGTHSFFSSVLEDENSASCSSSVCQQDQCSSPKLRLQTEKHGVTYFRADLSSIGFDLAENLVIDSSGSLIGSETDLINETNGRKGECSDVSVSTGLKSTWRCTSRLCNMVTSEGHEKDGYQVEKMSHLNAYGLNCSAESAHFQANKLSSMSIESRLLHSRKGCTSTDVNDKFPEEDTWDFEPGTQLCDLMSLCHELNEDGHIFSHREAAAASTFIECPICGVDISSLSDSLRQAHTNDCLDEQEDRHTRMQRLEPMENLANMLGSIASDSIAEIGCTEVISSKNLHVLCPLCGVDISELSEELRNVHTNDCLDGSMKEEGMPESVSNPIPQGQGLDANPVAEWLRSLGLSKYEEAFVREEVEWESLQWLKEEDLLGMGITALGPRKKIVHAICALQKNSHEAIVDKCNISTYEDRHVSIPPSRLITDFFKDCDGGNRSDSHMKHCDGGRRSYPVKEINKIGQNITKKSNSKESSCRKSKVKDRNVPTWCCIPGTPFRVDAFRYLRGDCSHWFLTHFHVDHYQGLTKNFSHGKIYCSSITAELLRTRICLPLDKLHVLPLNQKLDIAGVRVECFDANHCPGSIIILFEPPNGKAVLHTGDFRFSEEMVRNPTLQACHIHTLILDTTYCNLQYDFPKQEAVIQFVIEAIQAEAFNPRTLFLIGSYTIGKERLYLEVARFLKKKVYVDAAKFRILKCLGLPEGDMQWVTMNEMESHIHVVPLWTIASFKRMKHTIKQYSDRFNLIVAFSPTGWSFGKGKKNTPGRRTQQGTVIRYDVPYSEHSSYPELREFVQFISPEKIIPSVNNDGPESANSMIALLRASDPRQQSLVSN